MPEQSFTDWWLLHKDELIQNEQVGIREIAEAAWRAAREEADRKLEQFVTDYLFMRDCQNTYFRERTKTALQVSKAAEKKLDQMVSKVQPKKPETDQLSLPEMGGVDRSY